MPALQPSPNLREFFIKKIKAALLQQRLTVSAEVEFYLVNLLAHFADATNYFRTTLAGGRENRPLALRLYDATFQPERRFQHLKDLGDVSLYHAGVFYDGLYEQPINVDYYITMGASAYHSLANMTTPSTHRLSDIFAELGERFQALVEILYLCCEAEVANTDNDLLRLLDRYHKTRSQKAREILEGKGIDPARLATHLKILQ